MARYSMLVSFGLRLAPLGVVFLALGCNGCNSTPEPTTATTPTTETTSPPATSAPDTTAPSDGAACVTGGCSGELCLEPGSEQPAFTNCEYKREFECYKTATCKRDAAGKCGWEMTPELDKCLGRK